MASNLTPECPPADRRSLQCRWSHPKRKKNCNYSAGPVPRIESILLYSSHTKQEALSHLKRWPTAPVLTEGSVGTTFSIRLTSRGCQGPLASGTQPRMAPEGGIAVILATSFMLHLWTQHSQLAFGEEPPPPPKRDCKVFLPRP